MSLGISPRWKFKVFSGLFWASCSAYRCGFLNSSIYTGTFERPNFPRKFSPSIFSQASGCVWHTTPTLAFASVICGLFICLTLQCFKILLTSFLAWVNSKLSKIEMNTLHQSLSYTPDNLEQTYIIIYKLRMLCFF